MFPAALCPLSCSAASSPCLLSFFYIEQVLFIYTLLIICLGLFSSLFFSRLPSLLSSGPSPSLLTFGSLSADVQHIYLTHVFFLFSLHQILLFFSFSFFLTTLPSCFSTLFPLCSQPVHHLGVPGLGWDHQNHQSEVPQRFLGTSGSCQAGKPWPREGAGGWGCWVDLGGPDTAPGSRSRLVFTESSFVIVSPSFLIR